jgi:hypothetical protein
MERAETRPAVPKLAIWHLLLWMGCVAAIAAWNGAAIGSIQGSWLLKLQQVAAALTYYIVAGLALAGLLLAIGCVITRRSYYPVSAGHWLLTAGGLIVLLSEGSNQITAVWYHASGGTDQVKYTQIVGMYSFALMAVAYLAGAWLTNDSWPWRVIFVGYAAACLFWSIANAISTYGDRMIGYRLADIGQRIQWPWQWLLFAAVACLAAHDLNRRRSRDWLHWTGVGYVAAWVISQTVVILMHRLATQ